LEERKLTFLERVQKAERRNQTLLCVGLDPDPERIPQFLRKEPDGIFQFCKGVVDATHDLVLAFKPQIAFFAAQQAEPQLKQLIAYIHSATDIPVILDAKRGDIGSTAEMYAREAFDVYGADAVTVNPYCGHDALLPFLSRDDKGIIILCRTTNPGSFEIQNLRLENGRLLYEFIAHQAATVWNARGNVLLVAGGTHPDEIRHIRSIVGGMTLLIPGVGAQGANVSEMIKSARGGGVIVSSSRAINYAGTGEDFAAAARSAALATKEELNRSLHAICNDIRA
jgi:orotidine-5'-phosphate decarboxylase